MSENIKKSQIKRKASTGIELIHPETETDIVINDSTKVTGDNVTDVLDNSLGIVAGKNISLTPNTTDGTVTIAFTGSLAPNVTVQGTSPIAVSGSTTSTSATYTVSVQDATTSQKGAVQLEDSTSSTSTTTAATPNSVKSAYDLANTAKTNAASAQSKANSAYTLANGKQDKFSDGTATIVANVSGQNYIQIYKTVGQSGGKITTGTTSEYIYNKDQVDALLKGSTAYLGVGTAITTSTGVITGITTPGHDGDWCRVGTEFTLPAACSSTGNQETAHVGDILICTNYSTKSTTDPYKWDVLHTDVDTNTWRSIGADNNYTHTDNSRTLVIAGDTHYLNTQAYVSDGMDYLKVVHDKIKDSTETTSAATATAGSGRTYVTEVDIDDAGHVHGVKTATETVTNTHNSHSIHSGLKADGTTAIIGTASANTLEMADSGVTAGTYGDSSAQTPGYGGTFNVPYIQVNSKGIVTGISSHTVKIPASDNTDRYVNAASFSGSTSGVTGVRMTLTRAGSDTVKVTGDIPVATDSQFGVIKTGTGLSASDGTVSLATSGVTAGTYCAVKVDTYGRVTAGAHVIKYYAAGTTDANITSDTELVTGGFAFVAL